MRFRLVKTFIRKRHSKNKGEVDGRVKDFVEFGYNFCLHEMLLKSRTKLNAILAPYKSYFYSPSSPFLPSSLYSYCSNYKRSPPTDTLPWVNQHFHLYHGKSCKEKCYSITLFFNGLFLNIINIKRKFLLYKFL
jgi:hypothetical protein